MGGIDSALGRLIFQTENLGNSHLINVGHQKMLELGRPDAKSGTVVAESSTEKDKVSGTSIHLDLGDQVQVTAQNFVPTPFRARECKIHVFESSVLPSDDEVPALLWMLPQARTHLRPLYSSHPCTSTIFSTTNNTLTYSRAEQHQPIGSNLEVVIQIASSDSLTEDMDLLTSRVSSPLADETASVLIWIHVSVSHNTSIERVTKRSCCLTLGGGMLEAVRASELGNRGRQDV
ncbi:hypothetical protein DFH09DRAFT_1079681 [Mycena vulgaris]|nr:hypothetical protein DFH09DRAFT_1079681 [Mycena vulgaris]